MVKIKEHSLDIRQKVIDKRNLGISFGQISQDLLLPKSTVANIWYKHVQTGNIVTGNRLGRPRKLSDRGVRHLKGHVIGNRRESLQRVTNFASRFLRNNEVSKRTVQRYLHKYKIKRRIAVKKPFISDTNRRNRIQWVRLRAEWGIAQWMRVLWADEMAVETCSINKRVHVWRRPREKFVTSCIAPIMKSGSVTIHFWGLIGWDGIRVFTEIPNGAMNGENYIHILERNLLPHYNEENIYQHDNAPCHRSRIVQQWLEQNNITVLPWPAQSPNLSPIENCWGIIKQQLGKMDLPNRNRQTIVNAMQHLWHNLTIEEVRKCIRSMPRRCQLVLEANGYAIRY
jgi:transposase